ncbi:amino acid permease [Alicyclobacillus kakegawensis]|uniref:amino acid permease n=1 Tax=Alicyclobacillus kakegawensis TaxID=392012 RepID=UPI00082CEDE0|nr:amino acid permease [Alicyclobacillus kakegawensis]
MQTTDRRAVAKAAAGAPGRRADRDHSAQLGVWELVLIGVGGIMGAGFFLGSGQPIRSAGPSVLLAFLLGALVTAQAIGAVVSMAAHHPVQGSFAAFADMYLGRFAGYLQGWTYYVTSVLTIASEAVAMSVFARVWLPHVAGWMLTSAFIGVVVAINAFGVKNFGRVESVMSAVKTAALVGFIVYTVFWLLGRTGQVVHVTGTAGLWAGGVFPNGVTGLAQSMLIVVFAYAGIGVFTGAMTNLNSPRAMDKGAWWTVILLAVLYTLSIALLLCVVPWQGVSTNTSPFVAALHRMGVPVLGQIFNAVILVASFSVMSGAVFAANEILIGLAQQRVAPDFVRWGRGGRQTGALLATTVCIVAAVVLSYSLPANVYSFLISASSFFTFMTWFVIFWTFLSWRRRAATDHRFVSSLAFGQPWMTVVMMLFIVVLAGYALTNRDQRLGFYTCVVIWAILAAVYAVFLRGKGGRVEPSTGNGSAPGRADGRG